MRFVSCVLAACVAASLSSAASASVVAEVEGNDSLATAQNLDGYFTVGSDPNVTNAATTPYVSVISGPGGSNYDYYSFTVATAGSYGIFDIDFGMNEFDPWLTVFDAAGNLLTTQVTLATRIPEASIGTIRISIYVRDRGSVFRPCRILSEQFGRNRRLSAQRVAAEPGRSGGPRTVDLGNDAAWLRRGRLCAAPPPSAQARARLKIALLASRLPKFGRLAIELA